MSNTPDIATLIDHLQSDDIKMRQDAAIALGQLQDERLIAPLQRALHDPDATVRANAAAGLGQNRAVIALDALIVLLQDESDIVRERAAVALAQIGDERVIPPLIDAIDDPATWTRNRIIYVLGASRDPRAIDPLLEMLDHADPSTQGVAAWALGTMGAPAAIEPLQGLLRSDNADVRSNAAWALGEMHDERVIPMLSPLLNDDNPLVRSKTAWALGAIAEVTGATQVVPPLITLLDDFTEVRSQAAHVFVCQYAAEALVQIGTAEANAAVEAWRPRAETALQPYRVRDLIRGLSHPDMQIRDEAVAGLIEMGAVAVKPLLEALKHQHVRIRQQATRALGELGDARAVQPLITRLGDPDIGVWSQAVAALAKLGDAAVKPLRKSRQSNHNRTRLGVAIALWRIQRDEDAFQPLLVALQDDDIVIRGSAITSLWQQPDARAVATLIMRLNAETDPMMQKYVLQALNVIGTPEARGAIARWLQANPQS